MDTTTDQNIEQQQINTASQTVNDIEITDQEKEDFFKAFMANKPYTRTEDLFGGKLQVTFRSLTVKESSEVFDQLRREQLHDIINNDATYILKLSNYRMALALVDVGGEPYCPNITREHYLLDEKNPTDSYIVAKAEELQNWHIYKLTPIAEAFKRFESRLIKLSTEVNDQNFWKAAE